MGSQVSDFGYLGSNNIYKIYPARFRLTTKQSINSAKNYGSFVAEFQGFRHGQGGGEVRRIRGGERNKKEKKLWSAACLKVGQSYSYPIPISSIQKSEKWNLAS